MQSEDNNSNETATEFWRQYRLFAEMFLLHCTGRLSESDLSRLPDLSNPEASLYGEDWISTFAGDTSISIALCEYFKEKFDEAFSENPSIDPFEWCHENSRRLYEGTLFSMHHWLD